MARPCGCFPFQTIFLGADRTVVVPARHRIGKCFFSVVTRWYCCALFSDHFLNFYFLEFFSFALFLVKKTVSKEKKKIESADSDTKRRFPIGCHAKEKKKSLKNIHFKIINAKRLVLPDESSRSPSRRGRVINWGRDAGDQGVKKQKSTRRH